MGNAISSFISHIKQPTINRWLGGKDWQTYTYVVLPIWNRFPTSKGQRLTALTYDQAMEREHGPDLIRER